MKGCRSLAACLLVLAGTSVAATRLVAAQPYASAAGLAVRGYLSLRYAYVGSASRSTVYQALRLTGSFEVSAFSNRVSLKYRSHHWITFDHTKSAVLESPFENRSIFQTAYLELRDLPFKGLKLRGGRMFPEMDYASLLVIDGGWLSWEIGSLTLTGSAGRTIDYWSGKPDSGQLQAAGGLRYQTHSLRVSLGFNSGEYFGLKKSEMPGGVYALLGREFWFDAYGSYDFEARQLARAGLSLSWRSDPYNLSLTASVWTNPFDELTLADKNKTAIYWADFSDLPVTYRDLRFGFSTNGKGFGFRGSFGWLGGVRSGVVGNAYVVFPAFWGFRFTLGGQAMNSDFIQFYSADITAQRQFGNVLVQVQSQTRYYQWEPRASGFHTMDTYSELSVEYPLVRHFYLSLAGGGYFRKLGDERFKPQVEVRLIYRI